MRGAVFIGLMCVALGACSDPKSETPVALKPGIYNLVASGESYVEIGPSEKSGERCLTAFDVSEFERLPMVHATRRVSDCMDTAEPRAGNLVIGRRVCRSGWGKLDRTTTDFEARIREEQFVIYGKVRDGRDGSGGETGTFTVTGRRIGDC